MLKKILVLSIMFGSMVVGISTAAEAKTSNSITVNPDPQWQSDRRYQNRRYRNNRMRVYNRTRIVRRGNWTYQEVWQYRYLPNGRVASRLISRTRIYR